MAYDNFCSNLNAANQNASYISPFMGNGRWESPPDELTSKLQPSQPPAYDEDVALSGDPIAIPSIQSSASWDSTSIPLPIRPVRMGAGAAFVSSFESSQTLNFPDNPVPYQHAPAPPQPFSPYDDLLPPQDALGAIERVETGARRASAPLPIATARIPAPGGYWAWVPTPAEPASVPAHYGSLPLPTALPPNDYDFLNDIDFTEMSMALDSATVPVPVNGGGQQHLAARTNYTRFAVPGSCPALPTLLEDSLSGGDNNAGSGGGGSNGNASDETMHTAGPRMPPSRSSGALHRMGSGSLSARTSPLKVQQRSPRPVSMAMPINTAPHNDRYYELSQSCPGAINRPMRGIARQSSLAAKATAARTATDAASDDSDWEASEDEEEELRPSSFSHASNRRGGGGGFRAAHGSGKGGGGGAKKKHNPWTLEETTALVDGARTAGIGKWAEIKRLPGVKEVLACRTPVDLKDKWRNLARVARLPRTVLKARLQRGSAEIPIDLMFLVKQLMEAQMQDGE